MYVPWGELLVADSPLEAFAAALLCQPSRDGWQRRAVRALDGHGGVVAGVVLRLPPSVICGGDAAKFVCVSLGSGTRCVGYERPSHSPEINLLLRDGHAEVMARRGFVAFLLDAAMYLSQEEGRQHPFVEYCHFTRAGSQEAVGGETLWKCFRLRAAVTLHLVCTECPCGAMSIPRGGGHVILSTPSGQSLFAAAHAPAGTKLISKKEETSSASHDTTGAVGEDDRAVVECFGHVIAAHRSHPADKMLLVGRVKPGKGRQNLCMSCSDKLLRWHCLGIQGRRRARLFPRPLRLTSVWLPQTLEQENHGKDKKEDDFNSSSSLFQQTAQNALNDRICCFHPLASLEDVGGAPKEVCNVFHNVPIPPPVDFCGFTPSSLLRMLLTKGASSDNISEGVEEEDGKKNDESDSSWSRSAWIKMVLVEKRDVPFLLGSKRLREAETREEKSSHTLSWIKGSGVAVLNTKAGLPRGVTKQDAERTVQHLLKHQPGPLTGDAAYSDDDSAGDAVLKTIADRFPLSRLWMLYQQQRVIHYLMRGQQQHSSVATPFLLNKYDTQNPVGDNINMSLLHLPVPLLPADEMENHGKVMAGGSAHYWLMQARQCRDAVMNSLETVKNTVEYIPLLWVEKVVSV